MRTVEDAGRWDALLERLGAGDTVRPSPHVLQTWAWGDLKERWGWSATRLAWGDEGAEWAAVQVLVRRIGRTPVRVGYATKGPYVAERGAEHVVEQSAAHGAEYGVEHVAGSDRESGAGTRWSTVLGDLEGWARRQRLAVLKIDPDVAAERTDIAELWHRRGWRPSAEQIQFPNTMRSSLPAVADPASSISAGADDIAAALMESYRSKTRYNVRLAERRGVRIRRGGVGDIETMLALYAATAERQGFAIRTGDYYRDAWKAFLHADRAVVILAERDGRALAGAIPVRFGPTAWYLYGASADDGRADMAPHAAMHACLLWAAEHGCRVFDWWGGPTDPGDKGDPLAGVARFKEGFGAGWAPQLGAWDYAPWRTVAVGMRMAGRLRRGWLRR